MGRGKKKEKPVATAVFLTTQIILAFPTNVTVAVFRLRTFTIVINNMTNTYATAVRCSIVTVVVVFAFIQPLTEIVKNTQKIVSIWMKKKTSNGRYIFYDLKFVLLIFMSYMSVSIFHKICVFKMCLNTLKKIWKEQN